MVTSANPARTELPAIAERGLQGLLAAPRGLRTEDHVADRDDPRQRPERDEHPHSCHHRVGGEAEARAPQRALAGRGLLAAKPVGVDVPKPGNEVIGQTEQPLESRIREGIRHTQREHGQLPVHD